MEMAPVMSDTGQIGIIRDSEEFRTNTRRLAMFAEAIGDTNLPHLSGAVASPVFYHVPVMQSMVEVLKALTSGFILHGEQDFHYHQPMKPGQRLFSRSQLIGLRNSSAGALYYVRSDTKTHDGLAICTQYATCLVKGQQVREAGQTPPERPQPSRNGEPLQAAFDIAADQTLRYADAARDYSPYTIDAAVAGKLGLPAPIVHGMCTLALIARSIVDLTCDGDSGRLKRLCCRFSHPLYLVSGQVLNARLWRGPGTIAFEAEDNAGNLAVKSGIAEVVS